MKNEPHEPTNPPDAKTPGRPRDSGSRQQTEKNQTSQGVTSPPQENDGDQPGTEAVPVIPASAK